MSHLRRSLIFKLDLIWLAIRLLDFSLRLTFWDVYYQARVRRAPDTSVALVFLQREMDVLAAIYRRRAALLDAFLAKQEGRL